MVTVWGIGDDILSVTICIAGVPVGYPVTTTRQKSVSIFGVVEIEVFIVVERQGNICPTLNFGVILDIYLRRSPTSKGSTSRCGSAAIDAIIRRVSRIGTRADLSIS